MTVKHWLIGSALCFVGMGSAVASSRDTQDVENSARVTSDNPVPHDDSGSVNGDLAGFTHNCKPSTTNHDNAGGAGSANDHSGGGSSALPARPSHLGWQSLLPGSIQ